MNRKALVLVFFEYGTCGMSTESKRIIESVIHFFINRFSSDNVDEFFNLFIPFVEIDRCGNFTISNSKDTDNALNSTRSAKQVTHHRFCCTDGYHGVISKNTEVMHDVGYTDTKAFRTTFKKISGLSPVEYRNRYSKEMPSA